MYIPRQEELRKIAGVLTEKWGSRTHSLGHDASSKSRVMLGIAYRGEGADFRFRAVSHWNVKIQV